MDCKHISSQCTIANCERGARHWILWLRMYAPELVSKLLDVLRFRCHELEMGERFALLGAIKTCGASRSRFHSGFNPSFGKLALVGGNHTTSSLKTIMQQPPSRNLSTVGRIVDDISSNCIRFRNAPVIFSFLVH